MLSTDASVTKEPKFQHDCDHCTYLGTSNLDGKPHDWYICRGADSSSLIARYGSDGSDYRSTLVGCGYGLSLLEKAALTLGWDPSSIEREAMFRAMVREHCAGPNLARIEYDIIWKDNDGGELGRNFLTKD